MDELNQLGPHLEELRKRLVRMVLAVVIITAFVLTFHLDAVNYNGITLYYPFPDPLNNIAAQITVEMKNQLVPENVQLIQTAPGQAFFAQFYIAALLGIVFGMPVIVKELVSFVSPALGKNEIRIIRSMTIPAIGLFITGCVFSYLFVTPYILEFLYTYGEASGLVTFLNVVDFITFVLQFLLAFGISFQLPIVMYAVSASGLTDEKFWRKNIRYAIIIIVIFGAIITPDGSGITMWFVAGPMIGLYLLGMIFAERRGRQIATLKS
jgi:sec-independent protein translocase protein TatC